MTKRKPSILSVVSKVVSIAGWVVLGIAIIVFVKAQNADGGAAYTFSAISYEIVQEFVAALYFAGAFVLWGVAAIIRYFDNRRAKTGKRPN